MVYQCFDSKTSGSGIENEKIFQIKNQLKNYTNQLLENLKRRKVRSTFIDNSRGADLADMQ